VPIIAGYAAICRINKISPLKGGVIVDIYDKLLHKMETLDVMDYELFDLNGKNYCPVDGTITLKEFVDNDNAIHLFSFFDKVKLIEKFVKNDGKKALVSFEIFLKQPGNPKPGPSIVTHWVIEVSNDNKITSVDSFWGVDKFKQELKQHYPEYSKLFFKKW